MFGLGDVLEFLEHGHVDPVSPLVRRHPHHGPAAYRLERTFYPLAMVGRVVQPRLEDRGAHGGKRIEASFGQRIADPPDRLLPFNPEVVVHHVDHRFPHLLMVADRYQDGIVVEDRHR
jgi:hypothetical protein